MVKTWRLDITYKIGYTLLDLLVLKTLYSFSLIQSSFGLVFVEISWLMKFRILLWLVSLLNLIQAVSDVHWISWMYIWVFCMHACMFVFMCVYVCVCTYVHAYLSLCVYVIYAISFSVMCLFLQCILIPVCAVAELSILHRSATRSAACPAHIEHHQSTRHS